MTTITEEMKTEIYKVLDAVANDPVYPPAARCEAGLKKILAIIDPPEKVEPIVQYLAVYDSGIYRSGLTPKCCAHLIKVRGDKYGQFLDSFAVEYTPNPNGGKGTARIVEGGE